jgi:PEP-CTERM motif
MMKTPLKAAVFGVLSFAGLSTAYATPITGTVNTVGQASVNLTQINFLNIFGAGNLFNVSPPILGSFSTLVPGSSGAITNLNSASQPVGPTFSDPGWMIFPANGSGFPGARFDLTSIAPGSFTNAACFNPTIPMAGQTCTPFATSPFNETNLGTGTSVTGVLVGFAVAGNAVNLSTGEITRFTGSFSTQINGTNLQAINAIIVAGGTVTNSYSANFTAFCPAGTPNNCANTVPEPTTSSLFGTGLLGLGLLQRRRAKK